MPYLLGTDEAGYGPNLGPLVISASVWQVPDGVQGDGFYDLLRKVIRQAPRRTSGQRRRSDAQVAIGDSKRLYQPGNGWALLERGLWAMWSLLGQRPAVCGDVWNLLVGPGADCRHEALCGGCDDLALPRDFDPAGLDRMHTHLCAAFAEAAVRLVDLRSVAIFPREFNEVTDRCDSKGTALSRWTLGLVARLIERLPDDRIFILCDKHGGRDYYLPLLMDCFPGPFIEIVSEGRARSVYRFGPAERRVEFCFQAKGESHLPTALASMASKYLRELAMHAFNQHWLERLPELQPTAGYPGDSRRFKRGIAAMQQSLGIEDRIVWRTK